MSIRFREGEQIKIADRVPTNTDTKSGLYFNYYRNLTGTIFKIYGSGETAQVAVDVNLETLPSEVQQRHREVRDKMLGQLTGDAKKQSQAGGENEFNLRYVILVSMTDLLRLPKSKAA